MLDQNTDRMWFVIGAVIVGAAIIFIANGTLPDLFASVADSFDETAESGIAVIDRIVPMEKIDEEGYLNISWVFSNSYPNPRNPHHVRSATLQLAPNTTYEFSTSAGPTLTSGGSGVRNVFVHDVGIMPTTGMNGLFSEASRTITTDETGVVEIGLRDESAYRSAKNLEYIGFEDFKDGTYWVRVVKIDE